MNTPTIYQHPYEEVEHLKKGFKLASSKEQLWPILFYQILQPIYYKIDNQFLR